MKNSILIICIIALLISSCTEVYFTQSQPSGKKTLTEIPASLQGEFYFAKESDTIAVGDVWFEIDDEKAFLSDSVELKKFKNYYVLNLQDEELDYWEIFVIEDLAGDSMRILYIDGDDDEQAAILQSTTEATTITDDEGKVDYFVVNPSRKEFKKLITNGAFKEIGYYTRIK